MTTPKEYSVIDSTVYDTDRVKEGSDALRTGNKFYVDPDDKSSQQYEILNTVDTNDKYNSQGYEKNGFQGMAVAPVGVDGIPDYNHIIIAFAGTNATDWHLNDLSADLSNVVLGFEKDGTLDSQFTSALQFYDEMVKIYGSDNIEAVTGHSLGGALAQEVAAANHIPAVTFSTAGVGKQLTEAEKAWINGEGKEFILNFMHKGDQISSWTNASDYGTAIFAGDFGDGTLLSGHFLESYEFAKDGSLKDAKGRKPMKRQLKPIFTGLLSLLALIILGGCHMENKSEVATKESQITFLKAHEKEMTEYIKSQNNKIESVQYDWDSVEVGTIGNGLPQGGGKVMTMSGKFNELQNSSFMLSFGITKEQMPIMKEIGIMQPFRVLKNGVDEIYE